MSISVDLLEVFGDELMICNVARVSYDKHHDKMTKSDVKLIKYLWEHGHTSPFRHPKIQFRVECPIYVERQLFKHFVGIDTNSISGRYVDFSDKYTKIDGWRKQSMDSKQGSYGKVEDQLACQEIEDEVIELCKSSYRKLLDLGVSKEQARSVLPLNLNTKFIWTCSLQAVLHLFDLRLKADAQKETRDVVQLMKNRLVESGKFEHTMKIFEDFT